MIVVIADDLTGAAEIAGIGGRYSLKTELAIRHVPVVQTDLLVVCSDSRSLGKEEARRITAELAKEIIALRPAWIYKKIDSVLRGHVLDEIKVQMHRQGLHRALIIAANPSLGRTVRDGYYYVHDKPVHTTGFAADPEFPVVSSSVFQMTGASSDVNVAKHSGKLPANGITIGEAGSDEDMASWAGKIGNDVLLAGAADFFTALLDREYVVSQKNEAVINYPYLYISGTAFGKTEAFIREIDHRQKCVAYLPADMLSAGEANDKKWVESVSKLLKEQQRAVIAIDPAARPAHISALSLRNTMAKAVKTVLNNVSVGELLIEGGSTAASILQELDITRMEPDHEWERGVIRMRCGDLYITLKPGSYALPLPLANIYNHL